MKKLGSDKAFTYYGRQAGIGKPIRILRYRKGRKIAGTPDWLAVVEAPHDSILGRRPPKVGDMDWALKLNQAHWNLVKIRARETIKGFRPHGDPK